MDLATLGTLLHESTTCDCPLCSAIAPHLEAFATLLLAGPTLPAVWQAPGQYSFVANVHTTQLSNCTAVTTSED